MNDTFIIANAKTVFCIPVSKQMVITFCNFIFSPYGKNRAIKNEVKLKNIKIIELTKTNYRLLLGPFNDIKSLKDSFEKMNSLYFENLEIIKDA